MKFSVYAVGWMIIAKNEGYAGMDSEMRNAVRAAENRAQYDERAKRLLSQIIVNVEAQQKNPKEYKILNRAIFYACRMVSSQKERDFTKTNYDDIKRVVSIWVCMNMEENSMTHYRLAKEALIGNQKWDGKDDMISIVLLGLSEKIPAHDEKYELHRLLCVLLSQDLTSDEKLKIIGDEYDIPMEDGFRKGLQRPVDVGFKPTGAEAESEEVCVTLVRGLWKKQKEIWRKD